MKRVVKWLIALVAVAVVVVVVDRVAVIVVERQAVSAIEDTGEVGGADLSINGFPFLTQVISSELGHVTGSADTATFGGLSVSDVRIDARGVGISSPYPVGTGTASGAVAVESLQDLLQEKTGFDLLLSSDGEALRLTGSVLGLDLGVDLVPTVADPTTLGVTIHSVQVAGAVVSLDSLPSFISNQLTDIRFGLDLPAGVTLSSATVSGETVRIVINGNDIALEELVAS